MTNFLHILLCVLLPIGLYAQSDQDQYVEAKLISEVKWLQPGQPFWVALRLRMDPGWHTYWRNPGDSGLPTKIEWELPDGFTAGEIQWPFPERFADPPLVSYGYTDETFLLVQLQPPAALQPGTSIPLKARASWLVCKEACLPGSAALTLTLPVKATKPELEPRWEDAFAETRQKLPIDNAPWTVSAFREAKVLTLTITPPKESSREIRHLIFCPYEAMILDNSVEPRFEKKNGRYFLHYQISPMHRKPIKELSGVLVSDIGWNGPDSSRALRVNLEINSSNHH